MEPKMMSSLSTSWLSIPQKPPAFVFAWSYHFMQWYYVQELSCVEPQEVLEPQVPLLTLARLLLITDRLLPKEIRHPKNVTIRSG
jgi:hypothetical protein